jgi:hypothetical protein
VTHNEVVNKRKVLEKIKQTFRFLLDQKFGQKKRSACARVTAALNVGDESPGGPSSSSALIPAGILSQSQSSKDIPLSSPNDFVARPLSESNALPPSFLSFARHDATTLDVFTNTQVLLILQQRQQQRQQENERVIGLLQLLQTRNTGNAALQQSSLVGSIGTSHGGLGVRRDHNRIKFGNNIKSSDHKRSFLFKCCISTEHASRSQRTSMAEK